ncbi:cytochrome P450 [Nocardia vermiculata]|uniref:Cytochrome P450 n=1 Tax=Nocardia vermiculata TaxID=257274 RepID=A0A846Y2G9_9NOCA|nr:cytochrome P450 [Nocardia vermiculata]NKY52192.1 cytochrome P450 [Nocardia vermiculata]
MSGQPERVLSPAGSPAWLVTEYAAVRRLLNDPRLSRFAHPNPEHAPKFTHSEMIGAPLYDEDIDRLRAKGTEEFIAPIFKLGEQERLEEIVDAEVDAGFERMRESGSPCDIRHLLAYPMPPAVTSTLIGVPEPLRVQVRELANDASNINDGEISRGAATELTGLFLDLLRENPPESRDFMIGNIRRAIDRDGKTAEDVRLLAEMLKGIQIAGQMNATTTVEKALILMLTDERQRELFLADEAIVDDAIEEILRVGHPVFRRNSGSPRFALDDLEVDGVEIQRGDLVILDFESANEDPKKFTCPARFDIERRPAQHLAFGYGLHYCAGARLTRIELKSVLTQVFREFPKLRLVSDHQWRRREELLSGGVREIFVEW